MRPHPLPPQGGAAARRYPDHGDPGSLVVTLLLIVPLAACADGGTTEPQPQGGPAASIDRDADGALTGPVNQARDTAADAEARQQELEQAGD